MATFPDSAAESGTEALLSRPWIDPIGGYGDILMLSGVLQQLVEEDPERRFHLVRIEVDLSIGKRSRQLLDTVGRALPCQLICKILSVIRCDQ